MPRDYKHAKVKPAQSPSRPGWMWFIVGLMLGLFVALLVYVDGGRLIADYRASQSRPAKTTAKETQQKETPPRSKTRFEFYNLLPEMELAVPEAELVTPRVSAAKPGESTAYLLQVGSFRRLQDADRLKASLALLGLEAHVQVVAVNGQDKWHRVRLGPYSDLTQLRDVRHRLQENNLQAMVLKIKA